MRRRISSLHTFSTKFVVPVVAPVFVLFFFFVEASFGNVSPESVVFRIIVLASFFLYFYFISWQIKYVAIDSDNLYVSNYFREITVPIADIDHVTEFLLSEPRRITIQLRTPSEFGPKIVFLGTYRGFAFLSPHPIVDELQSLALRKYMAR